MEYIPAGKYPMKWPARAQRGLEILRQYGLRTLWIKFLGELVYRRVVLMERPVDRAVPEPKSRIPVTVTLLREEEIDEYRAFRPDANPVEIRRRLREGQRCFAVRHDADLVSVTWVATGHAWIEYLSRHVDLAAAEAYFYGAYTAPAYRGQNVGGPRAVEETRVLRDAGYRRFLATVTLEDPAAVRQAAKLGWRPCGILGYVKLGPWRHDFCRIHSRAVDPAQECTAAYWTGVGRRLGERTYYLDAFLGALKRWAYLDLIRRWGGVPAAGRVLKTDLFEEALGSSDAFLGDLCAPRNVVVGMDVSAAMAARARQRNGGRVRYIACDVRQLPFGTDSFDLVVSPSTLDHFSSQSDLHRSLCELARILTPAGRLIITVDNRQNVFDPLLRLAIRLRLVPYYIGRSYSIGELRAALETAGFAVEETTAIVHHPRMTAVAAVAVANRLGWGVLMRMVQRALTAGQRLEASSWRYYTGCFVAAKAVPRTSGGREPKPLHTAAG